jgi:hypothetical protein
MFLAGNAFAISQAKYWQSLDILVAPSSVDDANASKQINAYGPLMVVLGFRRRNTGPLEKITG